MHTTTHNLEDEPTLAEHNGKGLKALALTISEILHSIFSKHIFDKKVAFFHSFYQNRDDLHTTAQNLADEPTLADGPPWYQSRDALHTTTQIWQMNLLWLNTMAKV